MDFSLIFFNKKSENKNITEENPNSIIYMIQEKEINKFINNYNIQKISKTILKNLLQKLNIFF